MLPTILSNKRGTLIDNFLCKCLHGFLQTTDGIVTCGISDHFPHFLFPAISQTRGQLILNLRSNPNENYNVLTTTISKEMEKSIPTKLDKFNKKKHKQI